MTAPSYRGQVEGVTLAAASFGQLRFEFGRPLRDAGKGCLAQESHMRLRHQRASATLAVLLGAGLAFTSGDSGVSAGYAFVSSAHAQPLRKLIARLRGRTLPAGIVKAEGRTEATQVDVSSKYPGQLAEISVDEGTKVTVGQAIAKVSSPEFDAQLRGAQADLASSKDALASTTAEIASRQAALAFAKSDFERGQELMKSGFITKQIFEERQRNYEAAEAAVQNMTARRDEAQKAIEIAKAKLQQIQATIDDLTLVSPRNGEIQFKLKRAGETVAAGEPIVTVLDLTDIYMVVFLNAADAGRVVMGDEARVILDAVPEYVIPAQVSFIASDSQFTPKTVETEDERKKLMFRVNLRIDPEDLKKYYGRVEAGLRGAGFVLTSREAKWPAELQVKLPPAPALPPIAEAPAPTASTAPAKQATAQVAPQPVAQAVPPGPAQAPAVQAPIPPPPAPAPVAEAPKPEPAPAPVAQTAAPTPPPAPAAQAPAPPPAPAPVAQASRTAPAPVAETPAAAEPNTQAPTPVSETPTVGAQEASSEVAPESVAQLSGAWAYSRADCDKLFQRRGKALTFRQPVDQFAQAAIVESQRIRLPSATCQLERALQEDGALKVSADCRDSISYTSRTSSSNSNPKTRLPTVQRAIRSSRPP
jgi:HlyD family secretion protein